MGLDPAAWLALEERLRETASEFTYPGKALWGISTLVAHGLVCRCVALHGRDVMLGLTSYGERRSSLSTARKQCLREK